MTHGRLVIDKPDNEEHNGTNDEKYNNDWHEENQSSPESNVFWITKSNTINIVKKVIILLTNIIVSVFGKNEKSELGTILGEIWVGFG